MSRHNSRVIDDDQPRLPVNCRYSVELSAEQPNRRAEWICVTGGLAAKSASVQVGAGKHTVAADSAVGLKTQSDIRTAAISQSTHEWQPGKSVIVSAKGRYVACGAQDNRW